MSKRMIEIKRSIEKQHRRKKHIKEALEFSAGLFGTMMMFASMYLVLVFVGVLAG